MSKKRSSVSSISRSTKITLVSCLCFIALTCLILVFFVMFPITPSERIMASIGRGNAAGTENVVPVSTEAIVSTDKSASSSVKSGTTTTKTVKIVITTGSGFLWNGRVPTGISAGSDYSTTAVDPDKPTYDPGYVPPVVPNSGGTWGDPNAGGTWGDPNAGGTWGDPNAGGTWGDPNAGGGWVDPNAGGGTIVDPNAGGGGSIDPNGGGGSAEPNGGGGSVDPNTGGGSAEPNGGTPSGGGEPSVDVPPADVPDNGNNGGDTGAGNEPVSVW